MNETKSISGIMQAIFNIQQNAGYLKKDSQGQVGQGKFMYTNLTGTWDAVRQLLKDNNVVVYGSPTSHDDLGHSGNYYKNTLHHIPTGEEVTEYMQMVLTRQDPQAVGSAITFYRRYMTQAQLGLVPDDDNDAREQRLATLQQKRQIVGATRLTFAGAEDAEMLPEKINSLIESVIGKHPSQIREDEVDNTIKLIRSYGNEKGGEDENET